MHQSKYITPTLGRKSVAIVVAWFSVNAAVHFCFSTDNRAGARLGFSVILWLVGTAYGFSSGACWIASITKKASHRYIARVTVVAASALLLNGFATQNWLRHVANLGGLLVLQCILFFMLRIPDWEFPRISGQKGSSTRQHHQFRIADVIIATTSIALLLSIGIRYTTPIDALHYWVVMVMVWLACPLIAASLIGATMCRSPSGAIRWGTLAAILAAATAFGLSAAESMVSEGAMDISFSLPFYTSFVMGFALTMLVIGIAGRFGKPPIEEPFDPGTDETVSATESGLG